MSAAGLFPDAAILLAVEETEIVNRLLAPKLNKWRVKRDKRVAEKEKQKEIALKAKVDPAQIIHPFYKQIVNILPLFWKHSVRWFGGLGIKWLTNT